MALSDILNAKIRDLPMPARMARRPVDRRGFPVPYFVAWLSPMGASPMCLVNRTTAEPDCHPDCAEYAARACPFLANDKTRRNDKRELPAGVVAHELGHKRNPGVACVFIHTERWLKRIPQARGVTPLFRMPPNESRRLLFFANRERASRPQVMASLNSGLEILKKAAERDGQGALTELACYYAATVALVERWTDDFEEPTTVHDAGRRPLLSQV